MGVSGVGKSTVGSRLAERLGSPFLDADDFHDPAHMAQMREGRPLSEAQRRPWLDRLNAELRSRVDEGAVLACSALRRAHRRRLTNEMVGVRFVLLVADPGLLFARLAERSRGTDERGPGPDLLASQLATLEPPEDAIVADVALDPERVVDLVMSELDPG